MRLAATIALGVSSVFTTLMALICLAGAIFAPIMVAIEDRPGDPPWWFIAGIYGGLFVVQGISAALQIRGTVALNKADSYALAWVGTVAAFVGGAMCCNGYNLAAAIFLVIALATPPLRGEFEAVAAES